MKRMHLLLFVLLSANARAQTTNITVQVEPYKRLSYGAFYKSLVIKTDVPGPEHITGFAFIWGHRYTLKVRSHKLESPPEDGSDTEYTLLAVVKDERAQAGEEFELALEGGQSARFVPDADLGPPRPLEGDVRFSKVWTGHQEEPFTTGVAYLHFFRGGWTEPAVIELTDGDDFMTLELAPLTGRVTSTAEPLDEGKIKDQADDDPDLEGDE